MLDEFARIRYWTSERQTAAWQHSRGVVLGIGDDAAVLYFDSAQDGIAGERRQLIVSDTMVEHVHFAEHTMRDEHIGYKALAANVSDIAAMGGVPLHAVVSACVPATYGPERMKRIYDGLYACANQYGVAIVGGDTTSSPAHLVISVSLTGSVEAGKEIMRSGAKPGDAVFVTGPIGMSAAGLHLLQAGIGRMKSAGTVERNNEPLIAAHQHQADNGKTNSAETAERNNEPLVAAHQHQAGKDKTNSAGTAERNYEALVAAHQQPAPSVLAGRLLVHSGRCHSLNDVSDGLASEAWEIAEASGLRIVLDERSLPRSGSLSGYASSVGVDPLDWMLYGGEDYVLVGTMDSGGVSAVKTEFHNRGLPFYVIGRAEAGDPAVELIRVPYGWDGIRAGEFDEERPRVLLPKRGFNHF